MANIYITYNSQNEPTSVLWAQGLRDAEIASAWMKEEASRVEEINLEEVAKMTKIAFLLSSTPANSRNDFSHRPYGVDFRIWKRGI